MSQLSLLMNKQGMQITSNGILMYILHILIEILISVQLPVSLMQIRLLLLE